MKKTNYIIIFSVVILLIFSFFFSSFQKNKEKNKINDAINNDIKLDVQEFKDQGIEHISSHGNFDYNSNPPTSGPHYAIAPSFGFYSKQIDDESALHAVEHGGIWIGYKDLNKSEIDLLKSFAKNNNQSVIITKRPENNKRISAVAWTRLIESDNLDIKALQKFVLLYKNKTHEPLAK